jgi:hypothetical protein
VVEVAPGVWVTGGSGRRVNQENPPMRIYIIGNDGITLCREAPATVNEGEIAVASKEELHAARLIGKRLLALWNALPGVETRRKLGDREALIDQLWSAIEALPDPDRQSDTKGSSKQAGVIAMLQRPEGATIEEVASAMGWQRHTVRGLFSGTLKKKLKQRSWCRVPSGLSAPRFCRRNRRHPAEKCNRSLRHSNPLQRFSGWGIR